MQRDLGMVVGVDTHKDSHSAAMVDPMGALLAATDVGANRKGYRRLLEWARCQAPQRTWVVEGTGSYGAGLASFLAASGEVVFEGDRPQRRKPGAAGKSTSWTLSRSLAKPWLENITRFLDSAAIERRFGFCSAPGRVRSAPTARH